MRSKEEAKAWVIDAETTCTPKGYPLPFTEVISVKFTRKNVVVAQVKMFDGLLGTLEVSQHTFGGSPSWGLYWRDLPGGAIELVGIAWKRVVVSPPKQMMLEFEAIPQ